MINILSDFCKSAAGYRITGFIGALLLILKICVPIILVVIGTISLTKCITSQKKEEMNNEIKKFITKIICGIVIFFVPTIVTFIFSLVNMDDNPCFNCLLNTSMECIEIGKNMGNNSSADSLCTIHDGDPSSCVTPCIYVNGLCQKSE